MRHAIIILSCLAATLAATSSRAETPRPGAFQVSPVRVELSGARKTGLVTLRNGESERARFQVTAFEWTQTVNGEVKLEPTRDVSFFPSLFVLEPGQSRQIRIGVSVPASATERTWRVIVEQLPDATGTGGGTVRVLTRLSIPIFLSPGNGDAQIHLAKPAVADGRVSFTLRNDGVVHDMLKPVKVVGRDAAGKVIYERAEAGWYLLAGGERRYELELPRDACRRLRSVSVETATASRPFAASASVASASCSR